MKQGYSAMKRRKVTITTSEATMVEAAEALHAQVDLLDSQMADALPDDQAGLRQSKRDVQRAIEELGRQGVTIFGVRLPGADTEGELRGLVRSMRAGTGRCEGCGGALDQTGPLCRSCEVRR